MVFRVWPDVEAAEGGPERDALLQFRSAIAPKETDPVTALRFLRARDLNIAKANAMYADYLAWRTDERVDDVLTETIDPNVRLPRRAHLHSAPLNDGPAGSSGCGRSQQCWKRTFALACSTGETSWGGRYCTSPSVGLTCPHLRGRESLSMT